MADTSISFADKVWNPTTGCTMGCDYCYARRIAHRRLPKGGFTDREFSEIRFHPDRLAHPLKWKKPQRIFVDSMGDLLDPAVDWDWFYQIVSVMMNAPQHTFLVFTKFAARMQQYVNSRDIERLIFGRKSDHIFWCATAENQVAVDGRVSYVCNLKWGRKGVSVEPMRGPVNLEPYMNNLNWIVCGGTSGTDAMPIKPEWVRSLRDQCEAASVPFWFKQWGEYGMTYYRSAYAPVSSPEPSTAYSWGDGVYSPRIGRKSAGCLLDGKEYHQFPDVR